MALVPQLRHIAHRGLVEAYLQWQRRFGRVAFIHINKCGGTSVEAALGMPVKIHDTARQRIAKLGREKWDSMFTFSVVRHPYAKVASHHRYRIKTAQTGLDADPISLDDWILRAYGEQDPRYYDKPLMFAPCMEWLVDDAGAVAVRQVVKLEEIEQDWPSICAAIGRPLTLPHENRTKGGVTAPTLSSDAKAVIDRVFAPDFEAFGYVA